MEVRRLRPEEWPLLRATRLRALREEPGAYWSTLAQEEAFADEVWAARVAPEGSPQYVVEVGGSVVGLAAGHRADDGIAELVGMWVDPTQRGTGVADALVAAVVEWAQGPVRLWVMAGNDRAERAYRRLGFERTTTADEWFEMIRP